MTSSMADMSGAGISFPLFGEGFILEFKSYFTIAGWNIHWYGVIIAIGFLIASLYAIKRAPSFGLTDDNIIDMLIYTVPTAIIGARLYYVAFYEWSYTGELWEDILRIIRIWEGGLAVYGGVIGGVIGLLVYSGVKKIKAGAIADIGGLGLLIGQAIGRWGNFTNREAYGYRTNVPWKMGLTNEYGTFYYHPTFLYESLWNIVGFVLLHIYSKRRRRYDGEIFIMYAGWYGLGRLWIEPLRQDSLYLSGTNLRVSQLVAIASLLAAIGLLLYNRIAKNHEPEELWVNRKEVVNAAEEEPEAADEDYAEELTDALRILKYSKTIGEEEEETVADGPVVEPVDVKIVADTEEAEDTAEDKQ